MTNKAKSNISIIGGADGPTSVWIAGRDKNLLHSIKNAFRKKRYQIKRRKILKNLKANPHTLEGLRDYIIDKYDAVEVSENEQIYQQNFRNIKSSLVMRYKPELLGEPLENFRPKDFSNRDEVLKFIEKSDEYMKRAESVSAEEFPLDSHLYIIGTGDGCEIRVNIELNYEIMDAGGSAESGVKLKAILKDIYSYYGVSQEDINNDSERFKNLIAILSSD